VQPGTRRATHPGQFVKPHVKSNKNDFLDAEAIAEVEDGVSGFLVPMVTGPYGVRACDANYLAEVILKLLGSSELRREIDVQGAERVRRDFGSEQMAAGTLGFYKKVLGNTGSNPPLSSMASDLSHPSR